VRTGHAGARLAKSQPYPALKIFAPSVGLACGGDSVQHLMRVGMYVDAFNLYYGGRAHFGGGVVAGTGLRKGRWLPESASQIFLGLSGVPGTMWTPSASRSTPQTQFITVSEQQLSRRSQIEHGERESTSCWRARVDV